METKRITESNHHLWKGGTYMQGGYRMVKVTDHPRRNKRGYVPEQRLIMEQYLGRYLLPDETVHHKNGIRDDNRKDNLELKVNHSHHIREAHQGKRNPNNQFIASDPKFQQEKYRLYDKDRDTTHIYTLSKLIGTTFRRGCFQYRGRWTGLKDKNGIEIYEGDIVREECCSPDDPAHGFYGGEYEVRWSAYNAGFDLTQSDSKWPKQEDGYSYHSGLNQPSKLEVIGNIYENASLLQK